MKKLLPALFLILGACVVEANKVVLQPVYLPGNSVSDSAPGSPALHTVDGSGLSVPLNTGVNFPSLLAATHVANMDFTESWQTNASGMGGSYFGGVAPPPNPRLVFDLGANRMVSDLFFWQFQGTGGIGNTPGNGTRTLEVRFNTEAQGPNNFAGGSQLVTLQDMSSLNLVNVVQERPLPMAVPARYIELEITANFFGEDDDNLNPIVGGARVGLGEFRVAVESNPAIAVPPGLDLTNNGAPIMGIKIPVTNNGTEPLVMYTLQAAPGQFVEFVVQPGDPALFQQATPAWSPPLSAGNQIPPGATRNLCFNFNPNGRSGPLNARAKLTSNSEAAELVILDIGGITCDPQIYSARFPAVTIGPFPAGVGPQPFSVDVGNLGFINPLNITYPDGVAVVEGGPENYFDFVDPEMDVLPLMLNYLDSEDLAFQFDPKAGPGSHTAQVEILSDDACLGGTPYVVEITAEVVGDPEFSSPGSVIAPPPAAPISGLSASIDITNGTGDLLTIVSATIDSQTGQFTGISAPTTVAAGGSDSIDLTLDLPVGIGRYEATVLVEAQHPDFGGTFLFYIDVVVCAIEGVTLVVEEYDWPSGELALAVEDVPVGCTMHLRESIDGGRTFSVVPDTRFADGKNEFSRDEQTAITVSPGTSPDYVLQVFTGPAS